MRVDIRSLTDWPALLINISLRVEANFLVRQPAVSLHRRIASYKVAVLRDIFFFFSLTHLSGAPQKRLLNNFSNKFLFAPVNQSLGGFDSWKIKKKKISCPFRLKGTVSREFILNWDWGFKLGPTNLPHPILTSEHCPFNLLRSFQDGVHRSKRDFIIV